MAPFLKMRLWTLMTAGGFIRGVVSRVDFAREEERGREKKGPKWRNVASASQLCAVKTHSPVLQMALLAILTPGGTTFTNSTRWPETIYIVRPCSGRIRGGWPQVIRWPDVPASEGGQGKWILKNDKSIDPDSRLDGAQVKRGARIWVS